MMVLDDLSTAAAQVRQWLGQRRPQLAMVLGSGLADIVGQLKDRSQLSYREIAGFPNPAVAGHVGQLHCGLLAGQQVLVFQGRYHLYEGYSAWQVTGQVRLAAALGCRKMLLTNAVGGIADGMRPGDFMLVRDHLNLTGHNPLIGRSAAGFIDLSDLYCHGFYSQLRRQAERQTINLHCGVLAWMTGPNYETPAEIRALKQLGADAVSMSTVPEAIVSGQLGLKLVALSFISNLAAGCSAEKLDHQEVLNSGLQCVGDLYVLLEQLFPLWL